MLLLALLSLAVSSSDLPQYQQFCDSQGFGNCFPVTQVVTSINFDTIVVDSRDPISISNPQRLPMFILGEQGWELAFQTEWGSGVLIQKADHTYIAEIPLADDVVLHIFPCSDQEECTSFGYELLEDVDFVESEDEVRRSLEDAALRRSLDFFSDDCFSWNEMNMATVTWCAITLRVALPAGGNEAWLTDNAALIVAEFNEALQNSIGYRNADETEWFIYAMGLEHVDFVEWDESQDPTDACWDYKQTHDDTDITQCIVYDTMEIPGNPNVAGAAKRPEQAKRGMSWVQESFLPGGNRSGRHTCAHELGHNLGGRHVFNDGTAYLMMSGSEPNAENRLLQFAENARRTDTGANQNNVQEVRDNFQLMAELK